MATYLEITNLRVAPSFIDRTQMATAISAKLIKDTTTPGIEFIDWAKQSFTNRLETTRNVWTGALADNRSKTVDQILQGTDAQLQNQVDQLIQRYVTKGIWP